MCLICMTWVGTQTHDLFLHFCVGVPEPIEPPGPVVEDNTSRQRRYVSGQYFFEYLVVVSLKKAKDSSSYEPQITYQFPKVSLMVDCKCSVAQPNKVILECLLSETDYSYTLSARKKAFKTDEFHISMYDTVAGSTVPKSVSTDAKFWCVV